MRGPASFVRHLLWRGLQPSTRPGFRARPNWQSALDTPSLLRRDSVWGELLDGTDVNLGERTKIRRSVTLPASPHQCLAD